MQDDRIICETGTEARIAAIVAPVIEALEYRLVRVKLSSQDGLTLQIMAERPDGSMTIDDCEAVSLAVSPALDVDDPIEEAYQLEISSPGIDRPLVRRGDFENAIGDLVRIDMAVAVEGRKRFRGTMESVSETGIVIIAEQADEGQEARAELSFEGMASAKLIFTDALVKKMLKEDKRDRKEQRRNRRAGVAEPEEVDVEADTSVDDEE